MTVQAMKASSAQLLTEISRFYRSGAEFTARPG
jgi:D-3-phosphoglycerate dehydrogenase